MNDTSRGKKGKLVKEVKTYYPGDILILDMELLYETDTRLHVRVSEGSVVSKLSIGELHSFYQRW